MTKRQHKIVHETRRRTGSTQEKKMHSRRGVKRKRTARV